MYAASHLKYHAVEDACDEYLRLQVNKENCSDFLTLGYVHGLRGLCESCFKIMADNFEDLARGPDFLQLNVDQIVTLLGRNDLKAKNELVIFERMMDWINEDIPTR